MDKVLVDRDLLERILNWREGDAGDSGRDDLRAILAQPAEAEGVRDYLTEFAEGEVEAKTAIEELQDALSAVTAERDKSISLNADYIAMLGEAGLERDKLRAELETVKKVAYGNLELLDENFKLRAEVDELRKDKARLDAVEQECWDVRFLSSPNADAGDSSISIEIVGHFEAEPCERVVGENYNENLRAALDQAMTAEAYPPARPEYDERGRPVRAAMAAKEA